MRDELLGRATHDLDFATSATPDRTRDILAAARPDALYSVGERFGTVGAAFDKVNVEITTFRGETYQAGSRKPDVRYGLTLEDDLARRDFTINAMARDPLNGHIIDPFHGREDLEAHILRAVSDEPDKRFDEDPLRLLRAVRFSARFNFTIDQDTIAAIVELAPRIKDVSAERIRSA